MRLTSASPVQPQPDTALTFSDPHQAVFQVSVLESDIIRVVMRPEGQPRLDRTWMIVDSEGAMPPDGRQRDDLAPFSLPNFRQTPQGNQIFIQTEALQLSIQLDDFAITWRTPDGQTLAADTRVRAYAYDRAGRSIYHYLQRRPDEHYYGFGERSGALDKYGRRLRMLNFDAIGYDAETSDPLYKHFPFYITYVPELNLAYGLLYDNLATSVFDMGQEIDGYHGYYRCYQAEDGDLDYYFMLGPTIEGVVEKLARLTGKMLLPPRWSLGYLGSTMLYTDAPDAQEQLKQFVDLCQEHQIPCDLFHLSSGYSTGEEDGRRYVFTWNRHKVPSPQALTDYFHQAGLKLAANIKPYMLSTHPRYAEVLGLNGFITDPDTHSPVLATLWSGGPFESAQGAYLDFTNPAAYQWWQEQVTSALLDYGIDSTWNDNNEVQIWDDEALCQGFGAPIRLGLIRPLMAVLMSRASMEAQLQSRPQERPFLLCRSGSPGIQRYAQTWSGDNATSWKSLRYNIPMGLGLSLSGSPNTGHDVGGFFGPKPDPELFLRWIQNGIFHPRFTIHSYNTDGTVNEPWMYPGILPAVRYAMQFRYRLLPYLYSLFYEAAQTGHPIIRPMVYEFPHDPRCQTESFDFMLGKALLIASVLEPAARQREVYLPMGTGWYDFFTGHYYEGGQVITLDAPLERFPLLVRAGSLIPMGKAMRFVGQQADDLREIYLFPPSGAGEAHFSLIEDDGISLDYQQGGLTQVHLALKSTLNSIKLQVTVTGNYPLPYSELRLILPANEQRPLIVSGADQLTYRIVQGH
jgi:alpha-glucosidase